MLIQKTNIYCSLLSKLILIFFALSCSVLPGEPPTTTAMDNTGSGEQKPVLEQRYGESLFTKKYRFRIYKKKNYSNRDICRGLLKKKKKRYPYKCTGPINPKIVMSKKGNILDDDV